MWRWKIQRQEFLRRVGCPTGKRAIVSKCKFEIRLASGRKEAMLVRAAVVLRHVPSAGASRGEQLVVLSLTAKYQASL